MSHNQHFDISKGNKLARESLVLHNIIPGFCQFTPDQSVPVVKWSIRTMDLIYPYN